MGNNSQGKLHGRNPYLFTVNLKTVYSSREKRCFSPSCFISKLRKKKTQFEFAKGQLRTKFLLFCVSIQMNIYSEKEEKFLSLVLTLQLCKSQEGFPLATLLSSCY